MGYVLPSPTTCVHIIMNSDELEFHGHYYQNAYCRAPVSLKGNTSLHIAERLTGGCPVGTPEI